MKLEDQVKRFADLWADAGTVTGFTDVLPDLTHKRLELYTYLAASLPPGGATIKTLLSVPRVVVRGDPGCEKSTLMRYITWALASGKTTTIGEGLGNLVPVLVRAIEFGEAIPMRARLGIMRTFDRFTLRSRRRSLRLV